jgi:predicted nucleic acid-binding Zn ribbon protein
MKRTEAKNIGQIINDLLKQENLDVELDEHRASALWPQIVGDGINRYTIRRYVKDGVMTVHLSSASLANELMLNRDSIIQRINEALGREIIREIIFK